MERRLAARVVVVPVGACPEDLARRLAAEGATVVVMGPDGERAGRLLAAVEASGAGRGAFLATAGEAPSPDELEALVELVAELFG